MIERILNSMEASMNSQLVMYGAGASIILGLILVVIGLYLRKKQNQWWILAVLLGVVSVFTNVMQII